VRPIRCSRNGAGWRVGIDPRRRVPVAASIAIVGPSEAAAEDRRPDEARTERDQPLGDYRMIPLLAFFSRKATSKACICPLLRWMTETTSECLHAGHVDAADEQVGHLVTIIGRLSCQSTAIATIPLIRLVTMTPSSLGWLPSTVMLSPLRRPRR